ncbi:MAG: PP2C family serine/threonine-protein phosphatase [Caldilineaceae bacterium]
MKQWQMIAASVPGASHLRAGLPCQDAYRVAELTCGGMVVAVADGLGSARYADQGAQQAVAAVVERLGADIAALRPKRKRDWTKLLATGFATAQSAVKQIATAAGAPIAEYATTLIVVVIAGGWLTIGQIGDGAVVAQMADGKVRTLSKPQRGEFANETRPLTNAAALGSVRYLCRPQRPHALAIFSDGLQPVCLKRVTTYPINPFAPLFSQVGQTVSPLGRRSRTHPLPAIRTHPPALR